VGPVDYLVVEFLAWGANFSGEMAAELESLVDRGLVRVLDLVIVRKDADGSVEAVAPRRWSRAVSRLFSYTRTAGRRRSPRQCGGRVDSSAPTAASRCRRCWPVLQRTRKELDMPLGPRRRGRPGVIGGPATRTAAVVGTAAVFKYGHNRRENRRDDRRDRR